MPPKPHLRSSPARIRAAAVVASLLFALVRATPASPAPRAASGRQPFVVRSAGDGADARPGNGSCRTRRRKCTLRAAIQEADALPGTDEIDFHIGSGGPRTIFPGSMLPAITNPLVIDGPSQPGYRGRPLITLNGRKLGGWSDGLFIHLNSRGRTVIRALAVGRFSGAGINLSGGRGRVRVAGCYVGTNRTGRLDRGNGGPGIAVDGTPGTSIGGIWRRARNVISGNAGPGILIFGGARRTRILGNYVGTDGRGRSAMGNALEGIAVQHAAGTIIGGRSRRARNVISGNGRGNGRAGIGVYFPDTRHTKIRGNYIGTGARGRGPLANAAQGVAITAGANHNVVGGTHRGAGNLISGNWGNGVGFRDPGTKHNVVEGNLIGTDASGRHPLGNKLSGVLVELGASHERVGGKEARAGNVVAANRIGGVVVYHRSSRGNVIQGNFIGTNRSGRARLGNYGRGVYLQSSGNVVGGTRRSARNVIAYNRLNSYPFGAAIDVATGTRNALLGNSIHGNAGLGIDLGSNGSSANDPGDADSGPNRMQNTPVLLAARPLGVWGVLNSSPSTRFTIEIYQSGRCLPSHHTQGKRLLGRLRVRTNGLGHSAFRLTLRRRLVLGKAVTATAIDARGDTSEFSPCVVTTSR